mmetsp:Transcript_38357/g.62165  ORF Transcript_38357/g.62165 Transcript_38357/m.62165 type:complete len:111 (+) Transcript_38357:430-762(+)
MKYYTSNTLLMFVLTTTPTTPTTTTSFPYKSWGRVVHIYGQFHSVEWINLITVNCMVIEAIRWGGCTLSKRKRGMAFFFNVQCYLGRCPARSALWSCLSVLNSREIGHIH